MDHPSMAAIAAELAALNIATLRFQFPYMENELKRPDSPAIAQTAVRAAVAEASRRLPGVPLFAGGKSYGGRMTSQAQAVDPLPNVVGVVFVGFPLHPAGNPSLKRADHLTQVGVPMLFLQGTRDALADLGLLRVVVGRLGNRATLATFEDADHSFHVRKASGSTDDGVLRSMADTAADWMSSIAAQRR
jgi:predicted alpha/beta-hydrolase family hydrolase